MKSGKKWEKITMFSQEWRLTGLQCDTESNIKERQRNKEGNENEISIIENVSERNSLEKKICKEERKLLNLSSCKRF